MGSTSTSGADEKLCAQLFGYYVPSGQIRTVQLVVYYSDETSMR